MRRALALGGVIATVLAEHAKGVPVEPRELPTAPLDGEGAPKSSSDKPGGNRKQRKANESHEKRINRKIAKGLGGPTAAAISVLTQQRAVLARVLSCAIERQGGKIAITREDLDNARNLAFFATKQEGVMDSQTVLVVEGTDGTKPMQISIDDLVKLIGIGG